MDDRTKKLLADMRPPEQLPLEDVLARIDARDKHPTEYLKAKDRARALERDAADREAARDSWLRNGGDPKAFDKEWEKISTAAKRIKMEEEGRAARESFARYGRERF